MPRQGEGEFIFRDLSALIKLLAFSLYQSSIAGNEFKNFQKPASITKKILPTGTLLDKTKQVVTKENGFLQIYNELFVD